MGWKDNTAWQKGMRCHLCGDEILKRAHYSRDHIVPKSLGGRDTPDNIAPAHKICNSLRGCLEIREYRSTMREMSRA